MTRDPVDILLQLAFLEGAIGTHGAYEMALRGRSVPMPSDAIHDQALEDRLVAALGSAGAPDPLTVGAVLSQFRQEKKMDPRRFGAMLGLSPSMVLLLERDKISPLKLPCSFWITVRAILQIDIPRLGELIRRTHRLVFFGPALRGTLGRRRRETGKDTPGGDALDGAARELFARAELQLPADEEARVQRLLDRLDGTLRDPE